MPVRARRSLLEQLPMRVEEQHYQVQSARPPERVAQPQPTHRPADAVGRADKPLAIDLALCPALSAIRSWQPPILPYVQANWRASTASLPAAGRAGGHPAVGLSLLDSRRFA